MAPSSKLLRFAAVVASASFAALNFAQTPAPVGAPAFPHIPGFEITPQFIRADYVTADKLTFSEPLERWDSISQDARESVVYTSKKDWNPEKLHSNLLSPGFTAYFPKGIRFRTTSTGSPYLSWVDGSVDSDVPTPASKWLAISFRDDQPPLVLGFIGDGCSLQVTGKPGDWTIESPATYRGWVRFGLPFGATPHAANSAASLGKLCKAIAQNEIVWSGIEPKIVDRAIVSDAQSVTETITYNRDAVVMPTYYALAALGGYPIKIVTPHQRLGMVLDKSPTEISTTATLTVRFPVRRMGPGRALGIGLIEENPIGTVSPFDIPGVAELALENLIARRDRLTELAVTHTEQEYLQQAPWRTDPLRGQLPFAADGTGTDLAAAHAFLVSSDDLSQGDNSNAGSILTSLLWQQNYATGLIDAADPKTVQRTAAFCALACSLSNSDALRLSAGQFQAGLSGLRGLTLWRRRSNLLDAEPAVVEPLLGVRQAIFGLSGKKVEGTDFGASLYSAFRVIGDIQLSMSADWQLAWPTVENKPGLFQLVSPVDVSSLPVENLEKLSTEIERFVRIIYTPTVGGTCRADLVVPPGTDKPPVVQPVPTYSE